MSIQFCYYNHPNDYKRVDDFLVDHYKPGNLDGTGSNLPGNTCISTLCWTGHPWRKLGFGKMTGVSLPLCTQ